MAWSHWGCCAGALALLWSVGACGGGDEGGGGSSSTSSSSGTGGSSSSGTGGSSSSGTGGSSSSGTGGSSSSGTGGSSSSGTGGSSSSGTGGSGSCGPPTIGSSCSNNASIVRVRALLGGGMTPVSGNLVVKLTHAAGDGPNGPGMDHWESTKSGVTADPNTAVEHQIDMCAGSPMWSEENAQYNLWAWIDTDSNSTLNQGEPAGHELITVSCHDSGASCHTLVLDCTNGMGCVADGVGAGCSCTTPACSSSFSLCGC